jgi:hypothetical protein
MEITLSYKSFPGSINALIALVQAHPADVAERASSLFKQARKNL